MNLWKSGDLKKENIISRLRSMGPGQWIILLLLGLLLAVAAMPVSDQTHQDQTQKSLFSDTVGGKETGTIQVEKSRLEEKLEALLESVEGVGKVQVIVMSDENNETQAFSRSNAVQVTGVLVSAEGGGDPVVVKNIQEAVMSLFQLEAHKIKVMKMK